MGNSLLRPAGLGIRTVQTQENLMALQNKFEDRGATVNKHSEVYM